MTYYSMENYKFVKFERGTKFKKYNAILQNKKTGRTVKVPFGNVKYEHFRDSTGLGLYKHLDHLDKNRRKRFHARHRGFIKEGFYSPSYFSSNFLW